MHIDTSSKMYEKGDTGVAYKIIKTNTHKGLGLSSKLKKELRRDLDAEYDYARLYAICIYYLIKNDLHLFDTLIICNDEDFIPVRDYLDLLFSEDREFSKKEIISLSRVRKITGKEGLKSYAHNIANSYRRRVLKSVQRKQKGITLNQIFINYGLITEKWEEINKKM